MSRALWRSKGIARLIEKDHSEEVGVPGIDRIGKFRWRSDVFQVDWPTYASPNLDDKSRRSNFVISFSKVIQNSLP